MDLNIQSRQKLLEGPNITPLLDVVFILLIFFMLTSTFMVEEGIEVALPQASSSEQLKNQPKTIGIDSAGVVYIDGRIVTLEELDQKVASLLQTDKTQSFAIKSDQSVQVALLVGVIDRLKRVGVANLTIQTEMPQ